MLVSVNDRKRISLLCISPLFVTDKAKLQGDGVVVYGSRQDRMSSWFLPFTRPMLLNVDHVMSSISKVHMLWCLYGYGYYNIRSCT